MAVIKIVPMPGAKGDKGDDGATGAQGLQGPIGETGPAGADALWSYNGEWQSNATYAEGDLVTYDGQLYYATGITTLGVTPDLDSNFDLIAAKGADGIIGVDGAQGPQGEQGIQGIQGVQGEQGIQGEQGLPGVDGVGIPTGGNAGDILAKVDGTDYNTEWIQNYTSTVKHIVKNVSGSTLSVGTPVYVKITGSSSNNIPVDVSSNATEAASSKTMGLVAETILNNEFGFVITEGLLSGIDTSTANTGDPVWLGVNGQLIFGLANKPTAPAHLVYLGSVTRGQQVNGEIFVKVQNGYELDELHDVSITSPLDKQLIVFDAATGLWKNADAISASGIAYKAGIPATPTSTGQVGQLAIDGVNAVLYVCTSTNNWQKVSLNAANFNNAGGFI